ncbi:MAG: hypothetical protein MGF17_16300 [Trichodesmium sp. MAG_R04]|nr:hypothetical protein [Trichodesmium sp. MAG_R04]
MFSINLQAKDLRKIITFLITLVLISGFVGCSDRFSESPQILPQESPIISTAAKISEVSPPEIIQQLRQALNKYKPQVAIQSPQPEQIFEDNNITVQLELQDLPIFKSNLNIGPYIEVILDNKHYTKIYNLNESIVLSDLEPGTHTLRVFACRPWDESFKNEGAYAQTTFHIFTKTVNNNPAPNLPLLTYNSPIGIYGAEPIMIDYYLTNVPLPSVAIEDPEDEIDDWRIRITINGTSFITDQWQPIYLQGFYPGKNWVKLEYIDESGNQLNNVYNNTAHLITYKPDGEDSLSKITRGEISLKQALSIIAQEYIYEEPQLDITSETEEILIDEEIEGEEIFVEPEELQEIPTTEPTNEELEVEEVLNITKELEIEDPLQKNEPPHISEIVEKLPSNLNPNLEEVTESIENYSIDKNEEYQEKLLWNQNK